MSDELTFLRWFYANYHRLEDVGLEYDDNLKVICATYETETGNRVPNDYRVAVTA